MGIRAEVTRQVGSINRNKSDFPLEQSLSLTLYQPKILTGRLEGILSLLHKNLEKREQRLVWIFVNGVGRFFTMYLLVLAT
jgi:hypothetical protein